MLTNQLGILQSFRRLLLGTMFTASSLLPLHASAQVEDPPELTEGQSSTLQTAALQWSRGEQYDDGIHSFVASNASGWLLEVHESEQFFTSGLYYHLGKLDLSSGTVSWGPSRRFSSGGAWPSAAITAEGYVILTRSDAGYRCCSGLDYYTGTIKLTGSVDQEITFEEKQVYYDSGFHNGLSINAAGVIAEVHESSNGGLYYRQGRLKDPQIGLFTIEWITGTKGRKYDNGGVNPKVSINDNGDVVEVHGVPGESLLHYTRGAVTDGFLLFSDDHPRYDEKGFKPSVYLRNNGSILETHQDTGIFSRTGVLHSSNSTRVSWGTSERVTPQSVSSSYDSSVAVSAGWAMVTYSKNDHDLYYTVARLP